MYLNIILIILLIAVLSWLEVKLLINRGRYAPFVQFDFTAGVYIRFGGRDRPKRYKDL
jgi:hypothetical protein